MPRAQTARSRYQSTALIVVVAAEVKAEKIWGFMQSGGLTDEEIGILLPIPAGHRLQSMAPLASWLISMFQVLQARDSTRNMELATTDLNRRLSPPT